MANSPSRWCTSTKPHPLVEQNYRGIEGSRHPHYTRLHFVRKSVTAPLSFSPPLTIPSLLSSSCTGPRRRHLFEVNQQWHPLGLRATRCRLRFPPIEQRQITADILQAYTADPGGIFHALDGSCAWS